MAFSFSPHADSSARSLQLMRGQHPSPAHTAAEAGTPPRWPVRGSPTTSPRGAGTTTDSPRQFHHAPRPAAELLGTSPTGAHGAAGPSNARQPLHGGGGGAAAAALEGRRKARDRKVDGHEAEAVAGEGAHGEVGLLLERVPPVRRRGLEEDEDALPRLLRLLLLLLLLLLEWIRRGGCGCVCGSSGSVARRVQCRVDLHHRWEVTAQ